MEAAVIMAICPKCKKMYGMRTQKINDGDWWRTWAFPIDEKRAHNEGYDSTKMQGNLYHTGEYPCCPYCGTKTLCNAISATSFYVGTEKLDLSVNGAETI